ncbi:MAG: DUF1720 domain-containing protein [Ruminococcus sp.]
MDDFTNDTTSQDQTGFAPPQPDTPTQNDTAAPQQPEANNPFQQTPPVPESNPIPPQPETTNSFQQPNFSNFDMQNGQITGAQPKKKMKGWKVAVISVVSAVVVLGAASSIAYAASDTVKNFVKMNMGSEDNYYEWVIEKNSKDWGRSASENYEKRIALFKKEPQSDISMNITLTQEAQELLVQELFPNSTETIQLSSAAISCSGKVESEKLGGKLTVTLNDTQVLEGNAVIDANNLYVQIPTLSDQYLSMSLEDAVSEAKSELSSDTPFDVSSFFVTPDVLEERLSPSDLNGLFQRYGEVLADSDANIAILKEQELSIEDTNFSYTALEATYAGDHLQDLAEELLEELQEDQTITHYLTASGLMTEDDYKHGLQSALDDIRSNPASQEDGITVTFYVDPTGTIRGCSMADSSDLTDKVLDCYVGKDNDQIGIYFNLAEEFIVNGTLNEGSKETYSGTITVSGAGEGEEIRLDLADFKVVGEEHGYCTGNITVSIPDQTDAFTIQLDSDGSSQTISADIAVEGANYATIACTIGTSSGDDMTLTIPESALDMTSDSDMETYVGDGTQVETFLKNVGTALGISDVDRFVDEITGSPYVEDDMDLIEPDDTEPLPDTETEPVPTENNSEQEFEADLSAAAITYNGGKLFRFYDNNKDLIGLVDTSMNPTIDAEDYNWYYNADDTVEIGLENTTTQTANAADCSIFEILIEQGAPTDIKIGIVGIGSTFADLEKQFGIDIADGAETQPIYIVSIYDTATNGQIAYSFYLENGTITALDLVSYA